MDKCKNNTYKNFDSKGNEVGRKVKFVEHAKTPYFVMKTSTHCERVSKSKFSETLYPCVVVGTVKLKYNPACGTRQDFTCIFRSLLLSRVDKMFAQSLLSRAVSGVIDIGSVLNDALATIRTISSILQLGSTMFSLIWVKRINRWLVDLAVLLLDVLSVPILSGYRLVLYLIRFWRIFEEMPTDVMTAQSFEGLLTVLVSMCVPNHIIDIFRRLTVMTNAKILEDISVVHTVISYIADKIIVAVGMIPGCQRVVGKLAALWSNVASHHSLLFRANTMIKRWSLNKKLPVDENFRSEVKDIHESINKNDVLADWARTSGAIQKRLADFHALYRTCLSYEHATRQEPLCFAFEGPAGCFKSRYMGLFTELLGKSVYTHLIKAVGDGKDFYDQYDGQEIFVMDDLGQGGPSQYRTLFNLVSPIKYPLDCANEKLKDTKFFVSDTILFTTNAFMNINNVTKQDGITDLGALWRRACVFDFSCVRRDPRKTGAQALSGKIVIKSYNVNGRMFVEGYEGVRHIPTSIEVGDDNKILAWMLAHYNNMMSIKSSFHKSNALTEHARKEILKLSERYEYVDATSDMQAQGLDNSSPTGVYPLRDRSEVQAYQMLHEIEENLGITNSLYNEQLNALLSLVTEERGMEPVGTDSFFDRIKVWFGKGCSVVCQPEILAPIITVLLFQVASYLVTYMCNKFVDARKDEMWAQSISELVAHVAPSTSMNESIARQTFLCEFRGDNGKDKATAVVSGHYVIAPYHVSKGAKFISIIAKNDTCRLVDNAPIHVTFVEEEYDVAVWKLDANIMLPFKNISHLFSYNSACHHNYSLITSVGVLPVVGLYGKRSPKTVVKLAHNPIQLTDANSFAYSYTMPGLCGSWLVDNAKGLIGAHVAGNDEYGRALLWPKELVKHLQELCKKEKFLLPVEFREDTKIKSGIKLEANFNQSTPKNTNIVATALKEVFGAPQKEPVNLSKYGPHTVKDIAQKSFSNVSPVDSKDLEFAQAYISSIIEEFNEISESEVVKGFNNVARMNMTTATGIGCLNDRSQYFTENGYTDKLHTLLSDLENQITTGSVEVGTWIAKETLKDECRNVSKEREPRSFRVLRLPINVLCKQLTGQMVDQLITQRHYNGIMVGINPYQEWHQLYKGIDSTVIAADIKKFDGNMLPQVQFMVRDVIVEKFKASAQRKEILKTLLTSMIYNIVAINDDVVLTTHSMPSGCYLTAIMNSLVHKAYTAMWYCHMIDRATLTSFAADVCDYVYGDDKLCYILDKREKLNALTMRDYFRSIGLDLSTADKKPIEQPFDDWKNVNFLKRTFEYHPSLGRIMCPLVDDTLKSMLSWIDTSKDWNEAMEGKIRSFSYEIYLRRDYEELRKIVEQELLRLQLPYVLLPTATIKALFLRNEVESPYISL
jgi:hypothetical protein